MNILYLTNVPIPENRKLDAHFQELDALVERFGGRIISAFPLSRPNSLFPRMLYGRHNNYQIRKAARDADIVHVFSPGYYRYPYLRRLDNKYVIYSTLTPIRNFKPSRYVDHYITYDQDSLQLIRDAGVSAVSISPTFIDFPKQELPIPEKPFTLLMASAPWERSQFDSKGIHLLLLLLSRIPDLRIIFIWRNVLIEEMKRLVGHSAFADRIELVDGQVDIQHYLEKAHAVVLLAKQAALVKSYPHSLLEGLLSGRPILVSSTIPLSRLVRTSGCGVVVDEHDLDHLEKAVHELMGSYDRFRSQTGQLDTAQFSKDGFISFYEKHYTNRNASEKHNLS